MPDQRIFKKPSFVENWAFFLKLRVRSFEILSGQSASFRNKTNTQNKEDANQPKAVGF